MCLLRGQERRGEGGWGGDPQSPLKPSRALTLDDTGVAQSASWRCTQRDVGTGGGPAINAS